MKKLLILLLMLLFVAPVYSLTLEGGVKKIETAEQAHDYVFKYVPVKEINPVAYKAYANQAPEGYRTDGSNGSYSVASENKMYDYENNKLVSIAISDKNIMDFPRKLNRYEYPSGKLVQVTYGTSPTDGYIFKPDGSLLGVWEKGIYYIGDKQIGSARTSYY